MFSPIKCRWMRISSSADTSTILSSSMVRLLSHFHSLISSLRLQIRRSHLRGGDVVRSAGGLSLRGRTDAFRHGEIRSEQSNDQELLHALDQLQCQQTKPSLRQVRLSPPLLVRDPPLCVCAFRCDDPDIEDFGNKWSMSAMLRLLKSEGKDTFTLMMSIEDVVIKTLLAVESQISAACRMFVPTKGNCFGNLSPPSLLH